MECQKKENCCLKRFGKLLSLLVFMTAAFCISASAATYTADHFYTVAYASNNGKLQAIAVWQENGVNGNTSYLAIACKDPGTVTSSIEGVTGTSTITQDTLVIKDRNDNECFNGSPKDYTASINGANSTDMVFLVISANGAVLDDSLSVIVKTGKNGFDITPENPISIPALSSTITKISSVNVGITVPKAGETPSTSISYNDSPCNYTGTLSWSPSVSKFANSTTYTATIVLTPNKNCVFLADVLDETCMLGWEKDLGIDGKLTLTKQYTIGAAPKSNITPTVTMSNYTYNGTVSIPTISGNTGNGTVTYYYSTENSTSGGLKWRDITNTTLSAGTYYMYAVVGETTEYNSAISAPVAFTVSLEAYTGMTTTASANLVGSTGAAVEVTLPSIPNGASYGTVTNTHTDFFTVGTIASGQVTVTSAKNWNKTTENASKNFTVAVNGDANHSGYTITVTITPEFHDHDWQYSVSGATITASCKNANCDDTISNKVLTISAPQNLVYNGSNKEASLSASSLAGISSMPAIVYQYKATLGGEFAAASDIKSAGYYRASITVDTNKTASVDFEITKADITPTVSMSGYTYGAAVSTPSIGGNSGSGTVTYYYSTTNSNSGGAEWTNMTSTTLNAGMYYLYAVVGATNNYNAGTSAATQFSISKATTSVTTIPSAAAITYGQTLSNSSLTNGVGSVAGTFTWADATTAPKVSDSQTTTYNVTFIPTDTTNYNTVGCTVKLTVNPKALTISAAATNRAYDGTAIVSYTPSIVSGQIIGTDDVSVNGGSGTIADKNVGESKAVTISDAALSGSAASNYCISAQPTATVTISKANLTISSAEASDKQYDGTTMATVTSLTLSGFVNGETLTEGTDYTCSAAFDNAVAGDSKSVTVTVTLSNTQVANNYQLSSEVYQTYAAITLAPAIQDGDGHVDPTPSKDGENNIVFDGTSQPLINPGTYPNGTPMYYSKDVNEVPQKDDSNWSENIPYAVDADTYYVWYYVDGNEGYSDSDIIGPFAVTIDPMAVTPIIIGSASKTYDGTTNVPSNHTLSIALKKSNNDSVTDTNVGAAASFAYNASDVGTTKINASDITLTGSKKENYSLSAYSASNDTAGTITQSAGAASVSLSGWAYGESANTPVPVSATNGTSNVTYQYKVKGAADSTYSGTVPSSAGDYTLKATFAEVQNYTACAATTDFTIAKVSVTAPQIDSKTYSGEAQTASIDCTGKSYTVTINNGGTAAGSYDVVLTLSDPSNYKWSDVDSAAKTLQFTITKATNSWTTTPAVANVTYGTAISPAAASAFGSVTITYTGTSYNSTTAPTDAGSYTATFAVADCNNFSGLSTPVNFTIQPQEISTIALSITAPQKNGTPATTATMEANAHYSTGTVTWNDNPSTFASNTVYTATLTLTADANYTFASVITATVNGSIGGTVSANDGGTATVSVTFPATDNRAISSITVKECATKTSYECEESFAPAGLIITVHYDDSTTSDVAYSGNEAQFSFSPSASLAATDSKITVIYSGKTCEFAVSVSKKAITPTVSMSGYTYGETPSTPGIQGNSGSGDATYYYNTADSNSGGSKWENILPATLNAGDYYLYASVAETSSYQSGVSATKKFTISKATQLSPLASATNVGSNSVTLAAQSGHGTTKYGYSTNSTNSATDITNWQESNVILGLNKTTTYYFFVKYTGDANYYEALSAAACVTTLDHEHSWSYSASGDTITITCANEDGLHIGSVSQNLIIVAPTLSTFGESGKSAEATITGSVEGVTTPTISYYQGAIKLNEAPTDAGAYTAKMTINTATASAKYTIVNAEQNAPSISKSDETIKGKEDGKLTGLTDAMEYRKASENSYISIAGSEIENLAAGDYEVRYAAKKNYNASSDQTVTIGFTKALTVTFDPTGGSSVASLTDLAWQSNVTEPEVPTRAHSVFNGWLLNGEKFSFAATYRIEDDITLVAKWILSETDEAEETQFPTQHDASDTYTKVQVIGEEGTKASGLETVAKEVKAENTTKNVKLVLTFEKTTESNAPAQQVTDLKTAAGSKTLDLLDISLTKYINEVASGNITDTNDNVIEVIIPFDATGKTDIVVYRYHEGEPVKVFSQAQTGKDGTFYLSGNAVHAFTTKFSTYAIGYTTQQGDSNISGDEYGNNDSTAESDSKGTQTKFIDVSTDDYYYDAVVWAADKKITSGTDAMHFSPFRITTRAQMVTFLWRASGSPEPKMTVCPFYDVVKESFYEKAVMWGYENGYVKGTSKTTFSPNDNVTRGQTVAFLARLNGVSDEAAGYTHSFSDVFPTDYYHNAVAWAAANKITEGTSATTFSPNDDCLRCQIVTFIWRTFVKGVGAAGKKLGF